MTTLTQAEELLDRLDKDLAVESPEAIEASILEREDLRNDLQAEINSLDDEIDVREAKKRALRLMQRALNTDNGKLTSKKWELVRARKNMNAN